MNSFTKFTTMLSVFAVGGVLLAGTLMFNLLTASGVLTDVAWAATGLFIIVLTFLIILHTIGTLHILKQTQRDSLTSLSSRGQFLDALTTIINSANISTDTIHVILLDLNKFKQINDTLNHMAGDEILKIVANRIKSAVDDSCLAVSRVGGDEFAIIVKDTTDERTAYTAVAQTITSAITVPIRIEDKQIYMSASIGVATYPHSGRTAAELIRCAEIAMYAAKSTHKDFALYDRDLDTFKVADLSLAGEIRSAIDNDDFEVWFQPTKNLRTGKIDSVESLLRWNHPFRGLLMPDYFIPTAEMTGIIRQLTQFVIKQATQGYKVIKEHGYDLNISVNVSPNDIVDPIIMTTIIKSLVRGGMDPSRLVLEVTETSIMHEKDAAFKVLVALESLGIKLSIDDFGTGHSSFIYLKDFPISEIKLDRTFISDIQTSDECYSIVKSTIDLAHQLSASTVAEGVENDGVEEILIQLGCDRLQGYHLAKPMPLNDLITWLDAHDTRTT